MTIASLDQKLLSGAYGRILKAVKAVDDGTVELPFVVVVGDENQGKSSTIERLAMRQVFPRGEGFTTRMPIKLCMRNAAPGQESQVEFKHIRFPSPEAMTGNPTSGEVLAHELVPNPGDEFDGEANVSQAMLNFIQAGRNGQADDGRCILENELIEIVIRDPAVPDLDLYDLPGIVGAPYEVAEQTRRMTERFLSIPTTLILCVISARSTSLRNSQALGLVEKHNALGRTVTVLAQVDRGEGPQLLKGRMDGTSTDMHGIDHSNLCAVRNRGTDEKHSFKVAMEIESKWFQTHCPRALTTGRAGLVSVIERLNTMMEKHIRDNWRDGEVKRLEDMTVPIRDSINKLGSDPKSHNLKEVLESAMDIHLRNRLSNALSMQEEVVQKGLQNIWADDGFPWQRATNGSLNQSFIERVQWEEQAKAHVLLNIDCGSLTHGLQTFVCMAAFSDAALPINLSRFTGLSTAVNLLIEKNCTENFDVVYKNMKAALEYMTMTSTAPSNFMAEAKRHLSRIIASTCLLPLLDSSTREQKLKDIAAAASIDIMEESCSEVRAGYWKKLENIRQAIQVLVQH